MVVDELVVLFEHAEAVEFLGRGRIVLLKLGAILLKFGLEVGGAADGGKEGKDEEFGHYKLSPGFPN